MSSPICIHSSEERPGSASRFLSGPVSMLHGQQLCQMKCVVARYGLFPSPQWQHEPGPPGCGYSSFHRSFNFVCLCLTLPSCLIDVSQQITKHWGWWPARLCKTWCICLTNTLVVLVLKGGGNWYGAVSAPLIKAQWANDPHHEGKHHSLLITLCSLFTKFYHSIVVLCNFFFFLVRNPSYL